MTHSGEKPKNAANAKIPSLRRTFEISFNRTYWRKSKKCSDCKYAFSTAGNLRTHFMARSGEKPKNAANAKIPSLRRTFEISFNRTYWRKSKKCSDCKYAFSTAGDLRIHFMAHSGENPKNAVLLRKVKVYNFIRHMKVKVNNLVRQII